MFAKLTCLLALFSSALSSGFLGVSAGASFSLAAFFVFGLADLAVDGSFAGFEAGVPLGVALELLLLSLMVGLGFLTDSAR